MRAKSPIVIAILLSLSFLMAIPSPLIRVNAANYQQTTWSPYGPQVENMLITVYSEFTTMFNNFFAGSLDITDWPVQPSDKNGCKTSVDCLITPVESEFGIRQIDVNQAHPFFGVAYHTARAAASSTIKSVTTSPLPGGTCAAGQNRYTVILDMAEQSQLPAVYPDASVQALNKVSIVQTPVGSPSNTVGGSPGSNVYNMGCLLADNYAVRTAFWKPCTPPCTVSGVGPGLDVTVTFSAAFNSNSNQKNTLQGDEVLRALRHLIDKPSYQNTPQLQGQTVCPDLMAAAAEFPAGTVNCGNTPNDMTTGSAPKGGIVESSHTGCSAPISLYNCVADVKGCTDYWWATDGCGSPNAQVGYSGQTDLQAACDHFVAAGLTLKNGNCANLAAIALNTQAQGPPSCANIAAYTCPHLIIPPGKNQIIMYIRTDPQRRPSGQLLADTLQFFFGTPKHQPNNQVTQCAVNYGYLAPGAGNCTPTYYGISQIADIVFGITEAGGVPPGQDFLRDWHIYTGGFSLGSTPDHLWGLYNTDFSGGTANGGCAGLAEDEPNNYVEFCDPQYDQLTNAGEFAADLPTALTMFKAAAIYGAKKGVSNPTFVLSSRWIADNAWNWQAPNGKGQSSLVNQLGHGFETGFWSLLNMRCNPNYSPLSALFRCGGGNPELIRRGFSQDVHKLNVYHALTVWDFEVIGQIYDGPLIQNPRDPTQVLDWMTTTHSQSYNPNIDSCIPRTTGLDCASYVGQGTTTQILNFRNDLKFHDGTSVTADDYCFSVLTDEFVPSANIGPSVSQVASCKVLSQTKAEVKLVQKSAFYELNTAVPVVKAANYQGATRCNWPGINGKHDSTTLTAADISNMQASPCSDPAFDPMQGGYVTGSGPWVCRSSGGAVGGPCTSTGTQDVSLSGTITLGRNSDYMRCCPNLQGTSLQKESWADKNNDGKVDILDIADAALYFGQDHGYWDHALFGVTDNVVDIGEIATVAFYFDHGVTKPFAPSALLGMDPRIDPYSQPRNAPAGFNAGYISSERTGPSSGSVRVHFWTSTPAVPFSVTVEAHIGDPGTETVLGPVTVSTGTPTCAVGFCDYDIPVTISGSSISQSIELYVYITVNGIPLLDPNVLTHVGGTSGTGPYGVVAILPP